MPHKNVHTEEKNFVRVYCITILGSVISFTETSSKSLHAFMGYRVPVPFQREQLYFTHDRVFFYKALENYTAVYFA